MILHRDRAAVAAGGLRREPDGPEELAADPGRVERVLALPGRGGGVVTLDDALDRAASLACRRILRRRSGPQRFGVADGHAPGGVGHGDDQVGLKPGLDGLAARRAATWWTLWP